jgi:hypothetical protein
MDDAGIVRKNYGGQGIRAALTPVKVNRQQWASNDATAGAQRAWRRGEIR